MPNRKSILIIEDDTFTGELYQRQLVKAGYQASLVSDGVAGLQQVKEQIPDLILLDVMLPKMDGLEFLHKLRQEQEYQAIPVIILSNLDRDSTIKEGFNLGAQGYIIKSSMKPDEVVAEVNGVLSG